MNGRCTAEQRCKIVDILQYVLNFPKGEKYVSLLKDAADPEAQAALEAERDRLRGLVRQKIADERMISEVDEGVLSSGPVQAERGQEVSCGQGGL